MITGFNLVVSDALPSVPSGGEVARRIVRHGLSDVLTWLGEEPGPKPSDLIHVIHADRTFYVSAEMHDLIRSRVTA